MNLEDLRESNHAIGGWNILLAYRGSIAHGTYTPSSDPDTIDDRDLIGVAVPPPAYYFGLRELDEPGAPTTTTWLGQRGTEEVMEGEWDAVIYEARKTVHLLRKGNPNILALLWVPEDLIVSATPAGRMLIDARKLFAVRQTYHTFVGYARGQMRDMNASKQYRGYMGEKRRELVDRFGYDCKNASHMVRILRQGIEFLRDGELQVRRPDAAELTAIKKGEWTLAQVNEEAERLFRKAETVYRLCSLPDRVDNALADALAYAMVETTLTERAAEVEAMARLG